MTSAAATPARTRDIVLEELFPHPAAAIWRVLTSGELMTRWLMEPTGFEPRPGCRFTFRTNPAGAWDGVIQCEVLEVRENERLAFSWRGGHADNVGYGSALDTVVTFSLSRVPDGTKLSVVHSGFRLPENETAFRNMDDGWRKVVPRLGAAVEDTVPADA